MFTRESIIDLLFESIVATAIVRTTHPDLLRQERERGKKGGGGGGGVLSKFGMGALNCIMKGMEFLKYGKRAMNCMIESGSGI